MLVPPSKTKGDPEYDDRLIQILLRMGAGRKLDVRELVVMAESIEPAHLKENRRSIAALTGKMRLDMSLSNPAPTAICVFDDVPTA